MIRKLRTTFAGLVVLIGLLGGPVLLSMPAGAASIDPQQQACIGTGGTWTGSACTGNSTQADLPKLIKTGVNILLFALGAIAVIVIIIGSIRYVTSAGDSSKVTAAKNTILYAVVGVVIAILAYAIVNFVVKSF